MNIIKNILVLSLTLLVLTTNAYGEGQLPQKLAAIVNGEKIKNSTINYLVAQQIREDIKNRKKVTDETEQAMRRDWIDKLISKILLFQESLKKKTTVTEEEMNRTLTAMQKQGIETNTKDFQEEVKRDLSISKYLEKNHFANISISKSEVKTYFEAHKKDLATPKLIEVSHIVKKVEKKDSQAMRWEKMEKIQAVLREARKGDLPFSELAKIHSDAPSAQRGGTLGYIRKGQIGMAAFEKIAFKMKKGDISDVVKSKFGYHIIHVTDIKDPARMSLEEARINIVEQLKLQEMDKRVNTLMLQLRKKATIEVHY